MISKDSAWKSVGSIAVYEIILIYSGAKKFVKPFEGSIVLHKYDLNHDLFSVQVLKLEVNPIKQMSKTFYCI